MSPNNFVNPAAQMVALCTNYFFTGLTRALLFFLSEGLEKNTPAVTDVFKLVCSETKSAPCLSCSQTDRKCFFGSSLLARVVST